MSDLQNPRHSALLRAWDESGGDLNAASAAYYRVVDGEAAPVTAPPPDPVDSTEAEGGVPNPHRRTGDPTPATLAGLNIGELDELESSDPGLVDRALAAEDWDRRRAAAAERDEHEATRLAEQAAIANDPDATEAHFLQTDVRRFRERYWQIAPGERRAEAARLGIDLATYVPSSGAFGANLKESE